MNDNIKSYYKRALASNDYNVGTGWNRLMSNLCKNIIALDSTVRFTQVKQKFGSLRVYYKEGKIAERRTKIAYLVRLAEMSSTAICEECGSFDCVSKDTGLYVQSLCYECRKKLL